MHHKSEVLGPTDKGRKSELSLNEPSQNEILLYYCIRKA